MALSEIVPGDQVVFARLDVAEALGIWRHAKGRVVDTHHRSEGGPTVDVKFDGHETLQGYLPALFEKHARARAHSEAGDRFGARARPTTARGRPIAVGRP